MMLKKKVKELETVLKRTTSTLAKERKEFAVAKEQEEERRELERQGRERWKREVEMQLRRVRSETEQRMFASQSETEIRLGETQAAMAALEEQARERAQKEKEERVELLRRQVARRMMHAGITRGWTAWFGKWSEHRTQARLLQKAATRLAKPAVAAALTNWKMSWQEAEQKRAINEMRGELRAAGGDAESIKEEMEQMRAEYERKLKLAEENKASLLQKLTELDGGAEAARQELQEELARENEKRIEHLCQMIARRMLKKDLARGWSVWHSKWEEECKLRRHLAHAAGMMKNPELTEAWRVWKGLYTAVREELARRAQREKEKAMRREKEALKGGSAALNEELERLKKEYERKLQSSEQRLQQAMEKLTALDGGLAEAQMKYEMEREAENEKRVEHLCQMIARRMMRKELVRGWAGWQTAWEEQRRRNRMLAHAAQTLKNPGLPFAFRVWMDDWKSAQKEADRELKRAKLERERELVAATADLQAELDKVRAESENQLSAAEAKYRSAMERLEKLDSGAAEAERRMQKMVEKELQEKEQRVEHLCQLIARRFFKRDVARSLQAWIDLWEENCRLKRNIAFGAGMLKNPAMTQSWRDWKFLWVNTKAKLKERALQARAKAMDERLSEASSDAEALREELERAQAEFKKQLTEKNRQIRELQKSVDSTLDQNSGAALSLAEQHRREKELMEMQLVEANGASAAAQAQLYAQIEKENKEHEQRIEHLSGMMARRLLQKSLASGFTSWWSMWDERCRRKRVLAHAASRLKNPDLAEAFHLIVAEWQAAKRAKAERAQRVKEAQLSGGVVAAQAEMARISHEYEAKLRAAEETHRDLLEQLSKVDGGAAAAAMRLKQEQANGEKEREKRVEHLSQMMASRMQKKELARGWSGWVAKWEDECRRRRMLTFAAAKIKNPELSEAFHVWQAVVAAEHSAQEEKARRAAQRAKERELLSGTAEVQRQLETMQKDYENQLKVAAAAYESLMERLAKIDGKEALAERKLQEQLAQEAKEKEQRVDHLSQMMAKRMMNKDIVRGWIAWHSLWEEEARTKRLIKAAGQRLLKPALTAAFGCWKADWDEEERAKLVAQARQRELELGRSRDDLEKELVRLQKEMEMRLKEAENEKAAALEAQLMEIMGDKDHEKRAEAERMKEQRIEELYARMARRMMNQDIIRGFTTWVDMYETQKHMMRCMSKAGSKLVKPKLVNGFHSWVWVWQEEKRAAQRKRAEEKRAALAEDLRKAKLETGKLSMINMARDDELQALRQKLVLMSDDLTGKKAALMTAEEERAQFVKLQETQRETMRVLESVERERDEAVRQFAEEQEQSKALLRQLLDDQRRKTDEEMAKGRKTVSEATAKLKEQKERNSELKKEIEELKRRLPKKKEMPVPSGSKVVLSGDPNVPLSEQLAEALKKNSGRVLDLFRSWDTDGDGEVSRAEFHKAMPALGLELPKADVEELFSAWDADGGGKLAYKEIKRILAGGGVPPKKKIKLDGDEPLVEQLAKSLKANSGRVLDLFRSWDSDGDGEVSRKEFQKAIPALGYDVPKEAIDELFDFWDNDGGGSLAYKELKKLLAGQPSPKGPSTKMGKAAADTKRLAGAVSALNLLKK